MITLDYADKRPLYEQTKEKLRELIITGALKPHERIPSVRELAAGLSINPNTIQKAYRELEAEGYIYSKAAKGNYVCARSEQDIAGEKRICELYGILKNTVSELAFLGEDIEAVKKAVDKIYASKEESTDD